MAFSYTLFVALLLLFPGFCFWAGWRAGERTDFLTPSPDKPNSTLTLFIIVLGTIFGHLIGTLTFAIQSWGCSGPIACFELSFDPNVYKALLNGSGAMRTTSDFALEVWLSSTLLVGAVSGGLAFWLSRRKFLADRLDPIAFGWLSPAVKAVKEGNSFVVAYVLTKTNHEGVSMAYEGVIQQIALDDDQSVKMVVLNDVDRFVTVLSREGVGRIDAESAPINQLHIPGAEISNIALEIVRAPDQDIAAVEAADQEGS